MSYAPQLRGNDTVTYITENYSPTVEDTILICNHATVPFTVSLLPIAGHINQKLTIKNRGSATVSVDVTGGGALIFATSLTTSLGLSQGDCVTLINDGYYWTMIYNG